MRRLPSLGWWLLALAACVTVASAQRRFGGRGRWISEDVRTAREIPSNSTGTPNWTNLAGFETDAFTFVRIRRDGGGYRGGPWNTDLPDSDLNLSFRLQQMTSMRVDPDGRILRLTDPELANHPFLYLVEPGSLVLDDAEATALRQHLLNGGFLWLDDFWGEEEWENCAQVLQQVFPDRPVVDLPIEHQLYRSVFEITQQGQVPAIDYGVRSRYTQITWERPDAKEVHHRAIFDDQDRLMVFITHNTDNGDGWEREGEDDYYFHHFSEKIAYPLAVNVLFYVMTH